MSGTERNADSVWKSQSSIILLLSEIVKFSDNLPVTSNVVGGKLLCPLDFGRVAK